MNVLSWFLRKKEVKPVPVVAPIPEVSQEPKFLLEETSARYQEILAEVATERGRFHASTRGEEIRLSGEAERLDREVAEILRLASLEKNEAKAELLRRDAKRKEQEAERFRQLAARECGCRDKYQEPVPVVAEQRAREWERARITSEGTVVFTRVKPPAGKVVEADTNEPRIWDLVERRIVVFQGKHFLWQLRQKAVVDVKDMVLHGGPSWPATYSFSPTGEYGHLETEFVTNSVAQMTEEELSVLLGG